MSTPASTSSKVAQRRSQRVTLMLPVVVTGLDSAVSFQEVCQTMVISAYGCSVISPRSLDAGARVRLELPSGKRSATGRVVMGGRRTKDGKSWELGLELDESPNFWGIEFPSSDGPVSATGKFQALQTPSGSAAAEGTQPGRAPDRKSVV